MTATEPRPTLLDIIAVFFGAGREVPEGQVYYGPCDRLARPEPEPEAEL